MLRRLKQIGICLMALLVLAVLTGSGWELWMRRQAAREHPAPGRLVELGGWRMQLDCRGTGSPTVVFENGLDPIGSLSWSAVHDPIARTTRACAYSRSGIMWSDSHQGARDAEAIASDLHLLLQRAGERPPFVLVAHSIGGPYVMAYTRLQGGEVAGLIFVDTSHPDQTERMPAVLSVEKKGSLQAAENSERSQLALGDWLAWTGAPRILAPSAMAQGIGGHMSPQAISTVAAFLPQSLHSVRQESEALRTSLAEGGKLRRLGDRPLIVLTADADASAVMHQALGIGQADSERLQALWRTLQDEEASWSTQGRHWLVRDAHHYIQLDRPDVVVRAVQVVIDAVRRGTPPNPNGAEGLTLVSDVSNSNTAARADSGSGRLDR